MMQQRSKSRIVLIILAIILGLLFWSELLFSSVPSLLDIPSRATTLDWSINGARAYFMGLTILDLLGGVGIILFLVRFLRHGKGAQTTAVFHPTIILTLIYAAYQFGIAFVLPTELRVAYWAIGIAYALIAIGLMALYARLP